MRKSKTGGERGSQNFVSVSEVSAAGTERTAKASPAAFGEDAEVRVEVEKTNLNVRDKIKMLNNK